jgi:hypothetical protein
MDKVYAFDKIMSPQMNAGTFKVYSSDTTALEGRVQSNLVSVDISKYVQALFKYTDLQPQEGAYIHKVVTLQDSDNDITQWDVYWGKSTPFTADIEALNDAGVADTAECTASGAITLMWVDITGKWQTWTFLNGDDADESEASETDVENYIAATEMVRTISQGKSITMSRKICAPLQTKNQRMLLRTLAWSPLVVWVKDDEYIPIRVTSTSDIGSKALDNYEVEIAFSFDSQQM